MSKKKSELEIAAEKVESLITTTNNKITELGTHTFCLYNVLNTIQTQFDRIRNVPSEKKLEYQKLKEIQKGWKNQVKKIENDYKEAQQINVGGGAAGTSLGVGVATLGPTAAMGIATTFGVASTGTAISALSGAAATNAALAWLGGGALAAGGGGMAAGNALLALAGPIGWTIAGLALVSSGIFFWKTKSNQKKLENLFLLVSDRDQKYYKLAIVELNERIQRIIDETGNLTTAIIEVGSYGTDYESMTHEQQYNLGSYLNMMRASTQLLVNPILGLIPRVTESDLKKAKYIESEQNRELDKEDQLTLYLAGLLYGLKYDKTEFKLLVKSLRKNKDFLESMEIDKNRDMLNADLYDVVEEVIICAKNKKSS